MAPAQIRDQIYQLVDNTYAYSVPDDLGYARARSRVRGDRSIGLFSAMVGGALDIKPVLRVHQGDTAAVAKFRGRTDAWGRMFRFVSGKVRARLSVPHVVVSYAGALADVHGHAHYAELKQECALRGVHLHTLQMSITGMMNFGPGGLVVGLAAPEHLPAL